MKYYKLLPGLDCEELESQYGAIASFSTNLDTSWPLRESLANTRLIPQWPALPPIFKEVRKGFYTSLLINELGVLILSKDAVKELYRQGIAGFRCYPVHVVDCNNKSLNEYSIVMYVTHSLNILNLEKSSFDTFGNIRIDKKDEILVMKKIVIDRLLIKSDLDIFRLEEYPVAIIANEKFKNAWVKANLTGLGFEEVELI